MIELIATLAASAIAGAAGAYLFIQRRDWRNLVRSLALIAIFLGLYFLGVAKLLADAIAGLVAWVQATTWTQQMTGASIATGAGVLVWLLAGRLPVGTQPAKAAGTAVQASPAAKQVTAKRPDQAKRPPLDDEDAEIEALLRARGIQ